MSEWFSLDDLAAWGLPGYRVSRRRLAALVQEQGWRKNRDPRLGALARRRTGQGGGWQYHRACLSVPAQKILAERTISPADEGDGYISGAFTGAGSVQQSKAEARAALVRAADRFRAVQSLAKAAADHGFCRLYASGQADIPDWVRESVPTLSPGSLRRWRKRLRHSGLDGLTGRQGQHRKGSGLIDGQPKVADLIKGMLASYPHAGAGQVMQAIQARFSDNDDITLPSRRGLQRWLAGWKAAHPQVHAALVDPDKARSRFLMAVGDASEAVSRLNQIWELDSSPGDIILADGSRHTLIGAIDIYSRRLKLHVARTSSAAGVTALMRRAILDWGVPEAVRTDNGKDYISRHMRLLLDNLGIEHKICPPFSPEKKPHIERAFGTFTRDLVELLPGFTGHSVAERQGVRQRKNITAANLTPEEFQQFCDRWCDDVYAHNAHGGLNGVTPFAKAAQFTGAVRKIDNERALDIALMPPPTGSEWRVVGKRGVSVNTGCYIHPDLAAWTGRRVRVALDDADFGAVYLFDDQGHFICRAEDAATLGVDRREVATKTRQKQKEIVHTGLKELRKTAKQVKAQDIAQEILTSREDQAGGLAAFPAPMQNHTSPGLSAAEEAASVSPVGVPPDFPRGGAPPTGPPRVMRGPHGLLEPKVITALTDEEKAAADALFVKLNGDEVTNDKVVALHPSETTKEGRPAFVDDAAFIKWALNDPAASEADRSYAAELLKKSPTLRLLATG